MQNYALNFRVLSRHFKPLWGSNLPPYETFQADGQVGEFQEQLPDLLAVPRPEALVVRAAHRGYAVHGRERAAVGAQVHRGVDEALHAQEQAEQRRRVAAVQQEPEALRQPPAAPQARVAICTDAPHCLN